MPTDVRDLVPKHEAPRRFDRSSERRGWAHAQDSESARPSVGLGQGLEAGPERRTGLSEPAARPVLTGTWTLGEMEGAYHFSAGRSDDYLELREGATGHFPLPLAGLRATPDDALSLRPFPDRRGLSILQLLSSGDLVRTAPIEDRLARLVERLAATVFPGSWWRDGTLCLALASPVPVDTSIAVEAGNPDALDQGASEPPAPTTELVDKVPGAGVTGAEAVTVAVAEAEGDDPLADARTAVAEGYYGRAERIARSIPGEESDAFLTVLARARRAAKTVARQPRDPNAYTGLGWALVFVGTPDAALAAADRALQLKANHSCAYALRGMVWFMEGDEAAATAAYQRALECDGERDLHVRILRDALSGAPPETWAQEITAAEAGAASGAMGAAHAA